MKPTIVGALIVAAESSLQRAAWLSLVVRVQMGILCKDFQEERPSFWPGRPVRARSCVHWNNDARRLGAISHRAVPAPFPHGTLLTVALIASLCGGAEGAEPVKSKPLTPEQSACLNRAAAPGSGQKPQSSATRPA